ncbi:hypothetical protein L228DRAFT_278060 [Xylona heveae TC161]|uniref:Uncharacterized protein n=1 Tax=Xylona heveae (strain CBS 132557 / TC161) TaxID=1328760 RepID=A0A165G6H6_XYLHT|nr:hypothetical protein L228DRAFT_278060 [Xylona heveae TC161]KZF21796.1 hypothetical protein L228DRAFT_278060 [Xylona heveae TC161]
MSAPQHSGPGEGSAYTWILDHIMSYPESYEIPLRTMYTLNCVPRAQPLPHQLKNGGSQPVSSGTSTKSSSPTSATFPVDQLHGAQAAGLEFKSALMTHIARLPCQPCSLPPSFITQFLRRCFPAELDMVDFPQAMTALDYLKDLETRRRKEIAAALARLGVDRKTYATEAELAQRYPGVVAWIKSIEDKERRIEALYTQLYIGLRRWALINEMSLEPFNKHNCVAMLNTLYPPSSNSQPTSQLTPTVLNSQRGGFFRYIQGVEKNGPKILETLMQQGRRPGEANGWPAVRDTLDMYLRTTNGVIEECSEVSGVEVFAPEETDEKRKGRKVDSGVSFATDDRPSTSSSYSGRDKPLPPSPPIHGSPKGGSTLEKIAREFRKMKSRNKAEDAAKDERPKSRGLRSMKSIGTLSDLKERNMSSPSFASSSNRQPPAFDVEAMQRQRMMWEAAHNKSRNHSNASNEI